MTTLDQAMSRAAELGAADGEAAASWCFDGNTSRQAHMATLAGIEDGDPMTLDTFPSPDLSGEWADGHTPRSLTRDCGLDPDDPGVIEADATEALCTEYELAFATAVEDEIARVARYHLAD